MAQKVTVALEDDLTGGPAVKTVRFAFDGTDYEIDLNAKNAAAFGEQLAPYIEHARRAGRAPARRGGRSAASRQRSGDIRPGRKSMAWRSVSAAASRPAWSSSITPRATGAEPRHHRRTPQNAPPATGRPPSGLLPVGQDLFRHGRLRPGPGRRYPVLLH